MDCFWTAGWSIDPTYGQRIVVALLSLLRFRAIGRCATADPISSARQDRERLTSALDAEPVESDLHFCPPQERWRVHHPGEAFQKSVTSWSARVIRIMQPQVIAEHAGGCGGPRIVTDVTAAAPRLPAESNGTTA